MLYRELKRLFQSPLSYCCVLIYAGVMLLGILTDLSGGTNQSWFGLYWYTENFGVSSLIAVLVFSIAVSAVCYEERRGGYDWLVMMRSGCGKYCFVKAAAACMGSILMYLLSTLLFVCIGSIIAPSTLSNCTAEGIERFFSVKGVWSELAEDYGYWASFAFYVLLNALSVGTFSIITVCLSVYCSNRYIICAFPFMIDRLGTYVGGILSRLNYTPFGHEYSADGRIVTCILWNLAACTVLGLLYLGEMKWRRSHG